VLIAAAGIAAGLVAGVIDIPSSTAFGLVLVLVYFLFGYALYACAFAVAGVLVSRQEDTQSTTSPLILLLVIAYVVSISIEPTSTTAQIFTFLPPLAPLIVPARAIQDVLPAWELAASLVLMMAGIALMIGLASRIYERTILRMGAPISLREALRL
jgi:ABC-2 type transport system permease protein